MTWPLRGQTEWNHGRQRSAFVSRFTPISEKACSTKSMISCCWPVAFDKVCVCVCIRLFELCCMLCTSACDTWSSSEHQTSNLFTHSRFIETVCLGYIVWGKKSTNIGAVPNLESIRGGCRSIPLLGLVTIALHPEQHATELAGLRSGWETSMMENKK
jgi:hypothetical protein